jgi:amino acid adenylation domain-containing protein
MSIDIHDEDSYLAVPSYAQQRLWVMEQLEDGAPTYNVQMGTRLRGAVDEVVLRRVLDELMRRHEVLRTLLTIEDGRLVQLIRVKAAVPLTIWDVSAAEDAEGAWRLQADAELQRTFDTASELPVRARLLRLADDHHVLLLTLDHIFFDAWSLRVLHAELTRLYRAFEAEQPSPLPEPAIQYADYGAWQRAWLDGGEQDRQLDYWRRQLGGTPPRLILSGEAGTDRDQSLTCSHYLPDELIRGLGAIASDTNASLFSALLAGLCILLGRYSGQGEFVIGSLVSGRNRTELGNLIGFFVNTIGLRIDLSGAPTFRELLRRVHNVALGAYENQDVPFERVAEELAGEHDQNRTHPFFDVMFQLADLSREPVDTGRLRLEPLPIRTQPAPLDLVVGVMKDAGRYECVWDYQSAIFKPDAVARMQEQFTAVLRAAVAEPDCRIGELDLASAEERRLLTRDWNEVEDACDDFWCFADHFERVAVDNPDALALAHDETELSYAELDERANRLAHVMRRHGIGSEKLVGIFLERGIEQVISVLAVLKAGGAYVPLDTAYPAQRITYMLNDAAPSLLVTTGRMRERLFESTANSSPVILDLEDLAVELGSSPVTPPPRSVSAGNLAYVIYTSGSAGQPKGVAVAHRGLRILLGALDQMVGLTSSDRVLRYVSPSFDASVLEMLMAFGFGASLHVATVRDGVPADLAAFAAGERITALILPPSVIAAGLADAPLPDLRTMLIGGEECPRALAAAWSRGRRVFNAYGPTEATIVTAMHGVPAGETGPVPIGRMLPGVPVYVLNEHMRPAPVGVPGELYIGGQVLARSYFQRPAATADRFVPDPFSPLPGRRLYRTGDLVRWTADGTLIFIGRMDDQVKLRGYRIELGEIERTICSHHNVREAAAQLYGDPHGSKEIVCFAVLRDNVAGGEEELRAWCAKSLAPFMVPSRIILLDQMPVTPAGKIDRKALMAPARIAHPPGEETP